MSNFELDQYDAGYLSDFGGGNVAWWQDYIRAELERAYDFYQSQVNGTLVPSNEFYSLTFALEEASRSGFLDYGVDTAWEAFEATMWPPKNKED